MSNLCIISDPKRQRLLLFSVSFALFMVNLDTYIVNFSLPAIAHYFHADTAAVSWVSLAYNLTVASLLLIIGKLGDRYGLKKIFMLGFILFTASSLLCGVAPGLYWLVAARSIQGIGGSMLYAMTPTIVPKYLPAENRAPAFAALSTVTALGVAVGAPVGGLITAYLTWPWIFLVNLPIGIVALWVCQRVIPEEPKRLAETLETRFDIPGAFLSFAASFSIIYALNQGNTAGWLSGWVLGGFMIAALALMFFILRERTAKYPLVDLSIFRDRSFAFGIIATALAYGLLAGSNFLIPFFLTSVKGLDPSRAGLLFLIYSLVYMAAGPMSGRLSKRIPSRTLTIGAMALGGLASLAFAYLLSLPGLFATVIYLALCGVTYGTFTPSNNMAIMGSPPEGKHGVVAGIYRMTIRLSMALGVCVFESIFSWTTLRNAGGNTAAYASLPPDALALGFRWAFLTGAVFCLMTLLALLRSRPRKRVEI